MNSWIVEGNGSGTSNVSFVYLLYIFHCLYYFQYRLKQQCFLDCESLIPLNVFHLLFVTRVYLNYCVNLSSFDDSGIILAKRIKWRRRRWGWYNLRRSTRSLLWSKKQRSLNQSLMTVKRRRIRNTAAQIFIQGFYQRSLWTFRHVLRYLSLAGLVSFSNFLKTISKEIERNNDKHEHWRSYISQNTKNGDIYYRAWKCVQLKRALSYIICCHSSLLLHQVHILSIIAKDHSLKYEY